MAVFPSFKLTEKGEELLNRCIGEGKVLTFTKIKTGDGVPTQDWRELTDVQASFKEFSVLETSVQKDQVLRIKAYFDNKGFLEDKKFKEIGVFVKLEGLEGEFLYSYTNAGDTGDIIPSENRGFFSRTLDIANYIGYATNITFNIEQTRNDYDFNTEAEVKVATFLKAGDRIRLWGRLVQGDIRVRHGIVTGTDTSLTIDNGLFVQLTGEIVVNTIEDLKSLKGAIKGTDVEILGYYEKGDGAGHKRIISNADDSSGVQLANGLWANLINKVFKIDVLPSNNNGLLKALSLASKLNNSFVNNSYQIEITLKNGTHICDTSVVLRGCNLENVRILGENEETTVLKVKPTYLNNLLVLLGSTVGEIANFKLTHTDDYIVNTNVSTGIDVSIDTPDSLTFLKLTMASRVPRIRNFKCFTSSVNTIVGIGVSLSTGSAVGNGEKITTENIRCSVSAYSNSSIYIGEGEGNGLISNNSLVGLNCHESFVSIRNYNFTGNKAKECVAIENNAGNVRIKFGNIDTNYIFNLFATSITSLTSATYNFTTQACKSDGRTNLLCTDAKFNNSNRSLTSDKITSLTADFWESGIYTYTGDNAASRDIPIPFLRQAIISDGDNTITLGAGTTYSLTSKTDSTRQVVAFIPSVTSESSYLRVYNPRQDATMNKNGVTYNIFYTR